MVGAPPGERGEPSPPAKEHCLNGNVEITTTGAGPAARSGQPAASTTEAPRRMLDALQQPLLPLWLALLGMVLTLPALRAGLIGDDLYHRSVLSGARVFNDLAPSAGNMFRFFDGDAGRTLRMMDLGTVPWFTWPGAKGAFWRPVTVLTHWLDYRLWPDWPVLMHAQSILWFGAVVVVVTLLYQRLMAHGAGTIGGGAVIPETAATTRADIHSTLPLAAGLAALLYAIDDARGLPVGFLANRNTLICTFFGVLALLAHDRWRGRRGGACRPGATRKRHWICTALAASALLALSLLAKEEGIGVCAYLLAYAIFLDRSSWRGRLLSLMPYAAVVVVWRIAWTALGFGVDGVGYYVDPLGEPVRFLWAVLERGPVLLLGQWGLPPAEITLLLGKVGRTALWFAAVVLLSVVGFVLYPLIRGGGSEDQGGAPGTHPATLARFWATGMLLAVVPICTAFPADRMLSFVGLGAMGLLSQFFCAAMRHSSRSRTRSMMGVAFVSIHLVIAPIMLPLRAGWPTGPGWSRWEIRTPLDESIARQDLVLVNPPSAMHVAYFVVQRDFAGLPVPRHIRQLASGPGPLTMQRLDERTLEIRPNNGYGGWAFERLFRTEQHPFKAGDRIALTGMNIEITEVAPDGRPAVARFRFGVPLEDGSLRWLAFEHGEFRPFKPPQIGGEVKLGGW
jgi:hypothetical protein